MAGHYYARNLFIMIMAHIFGYLNDNIMLEINALYRDVLVGQFMCALQ